MTRALALLISLGIALGAPAAAHAASVSGQVTAAATGSPVIGADVLLYDDAWMFVSFTTSGGDGRYAFEGVAAGSYRVAFTGGQGSDFAPQLYDGAATIAEADAVVLASASSAAGNVDAALQSGGRISGTVTAAETGAPVEGATVYASDPESSYGASAETDANGHYVVTGLKSGDHIVSFTAPGGTNLMAETYDGHRSGGGEDLVAVTAAETTSGIDAALEPGGRITGSVSEMGSHAALEGIDVYALTSDQDVAGFASTAADGDYVLDGLPTGDYVVGFSSYLSTGGERREYYDDKAAFEAADPVHVTERSDTAGIDAELEPTSQISGTVTDDATDAPLGGILVTVYDDANTYVASAWSNETGRYRVTGLAAGTYKVVFSDTGNRGYRSSYYDGESSFMNADAVTVTDGAATSGIDGALSRGGTIDGTVVNAAGQPVAGVLVQAVDGAGSYVTSTTTDPAGRYTLSGLADGAYRVGFLPYATGLDFVAVYYDGAATLAAADPVAVTVGEATHLEPVELQASGSISGRVTRATDGAALPGATVIVYDTATGAAVATGISGADGQYVVHGVPAGSYRVGFSASPGGASYAFQYYSGKDYSNADTVTVSVGATTTGINAAMQQGGGISGTVTDAETGAPVAGALVLAYASEGMASGVYTDGAGRYTISGIAAGSYRVSFSTPSGGYRTVFYEGKEAYADADPVTVAGGAITPGIDAALPKGGRISGTVIGPEGEPLASITVAAYPKGGGPAHTAVTDSAGHYTVGGLPTGDYTLQIGGGDFIRVEYNGLVHAETGQITAGIDQVLQRGGRIVGSVVDRETGLPIPGVSVAVTGDIGDRTYYANATSEASGGFAVRGLPTAAYDLVATDPAGHHLPVDIGDIAVTAPDDTELGDQQMDPAGTVAGTVTDAQSGTPLANTLVRLYDADSFDPLQSVYTDSIGRYRFAATEPGTYKVAFGEEADSEYGVQYYDGKGSLALADEVTIAKRTTTQADGRLTKRPTLVTGPTVTGTAKQGQTLTATAAQWTRNPTSITRQWLRCAADSDSCTPIGGASALTYTAGAADGGYRLAFRETAANAAGPSEPARSALTDVIVPLPPVNVAAPGVSGETREGRVLSVVHGDWLNAVASYEHQWLRCEPFGSGCLPIAGAVGDSYTLTAADTAHRIAVQEIAVNAGGRGEAVNSNPSPVVVPQVPSNLERPTVSGQAKQGETLTATDGRWSGEPTSFGRQWRRCDDDGSGCSDISGATGASYLLRSADVGHSIVMAVIASNAGGPSDPATSLPTDAVVATRPVNTASPSISGLAKQGEQLTGHAGSWSFEPDSYAYTWLACDENGGACTAIDGATASTFTPTAAEVGHRLRLRVVASNAGGASLPATSSATDPMLPPLPASTSRPTIEGTAQEGRTLTAHHGGWTNDPTSYALTWQRCETNGSGCQDIPGATAETYLIGADDVGRRLVVREVASNAAGDGLAATSMLTDAVAAGPPVSTAPPVVTGTVRGGDVLFASPGEWTNAPTSFAFQWLRCAPDGTACNPIDGATNSAFAIPPTDAGRTLAVEVSATGPGGTSAPARSAVTDVVAPAPAPETAILTAPPAVTREDEQIVAFASDVPGASFECRLGDDDFAPCSSPKVFARLAEESYTFEVRAKAANRGIDETPASVTWTVDRTPPDTSIASAPDGPVHSGVAFTFDSSDGVDFECATDSGEFSRCASGVAVGTTGLTPGVHTFRVRAKDAAGNVDPTPATGTFTFADERPAATLDVTPREGTAPLTVHASVSATDADGDELRYKLDFGDGTVTSGALPRTAAIEHTYAHPGFHVVRLEVDDGHVSDVVAEHVTAVLAEPLRADAGDDLVAVAGEGVTLRGTGSRPTAGIEDYEWDFGDGRTGHGATVSHAWTTPGTYTARLVTRAGGVSDADTASVRVVSPEAADGLGVTVRSGGGPVAGADVLVVTADGRRVSGVSDAAGRTRLHGLGDGAYSVLTYAAGYLPKSTQATVSGGNGSADVELTPGEVAKAEVTSRPLSIDEIRALGINENDPDNQRVVKFMIKLQTTSLSGCANDGGFIPACGGGGGDGGGGLTCTRVRCNGNFGDGRVVLDHVDLGDGNAGLTTLVIPGRAKWLKEFFEVAMTIHNLAPDPQFVLRNGAAELALESGLSLAPTARGEHLRVPVGDIAGGQSKSATWIVRGDQEGSYTLGANYAATLEPFGSPVTVEARMEDPLKVWGASALRLTVDADETAYEGHPYHVTVGLENVADVPIYNVSLELLEDGAKNFIYQPREQLSHFAGTLEPGGTLDHDYILVPTLTSDVDVGKSAVSFGAGAESLASEITTHPVVNPPETAPDVRVFPMKDKLGLRWDPVPGATSYAVYSTSAPNVAFPANPDPNVEILPADDGKPRAVVRNLANATKRYYAISPIVGGRPLMSHKLISGEPSDDVVLPDIDVEYHWKSGTTHTCGGSGLATFTFEDEFFDVTSYTITATGLQPKSKSGLAGHLAIDSLEIPKLAEDETLTLTGTAKNSDGDSRTWQTTLDGKCGYDTAVVVAMGWRSSLKNSGHDGYDKITTDPVCHSRLGPPEATGTDDFNDQAGTNACDGNGDKTGNLMAWLKDQGYTPGAKRQSPNRTLLEFSYNGATASCDGDSDPTFVPHDYVSDDTTWELLNGPLADSYLTASIYLRALVKYDECWRKTKGRSLRFTAIGHSLGGYEALALARAAAANGHADLISGVVSVDGAIHPEMVIPDINVQCGMNNFLQDVVDLFVDVRGLDPLYQFNNWLTHRDQVKKIGAHIQDVKAAGIDVATVTNHEDSCLRETTTINDFATDTEVWKVALKGWSGKESHGALLHSHHDVPEDAGFPLVEFLRSRGYVLRQGAYLPPVSEAVKRAARAAATVAGADALTGRVVWSGTDDPVGGAQVVAIGDDAMEYTSVAADGRFSFASLPPGGYKLRATSLGGERSGAWAGGAKVETATLFTVGAVPVDAGALAIARPVTTSVTLVDANGAPLAGGVAMLLDEEQRPVTHGETDADGRVDLVAPPGRYTLAAAALRAQAKAQAIDATESGNVDVTLAPGVDITATARDDAGNPLAGVLVALYGADDKMTAFGATNSDGMFTFAGRSTGQYSVRLWEPFDRIDVPDVRIPVAADPANPAAGEATFQSGLSPVLSSGAPAADARVGQPYSFAFTASGAPGMTFAVASGELPPGVALGADGRLAGVPTLAGSYTFTLRVTNGAGTIIDGPFTITVGAPRPSITSGSPPEGKVGRDYRFVFTASGTPAPAFTITSGALPAGLALDRDGTLHGVPTAAGTSSFEVTARNDGGAVAASYAVQVRPADQPPVVATPTPTPTADTGHGPGTGGGQDTVAPKISGLKAVTSGKAFATLAGKGRLSASLSVDEPASVTGELLLTAGTASKLKLKGGKVKRAGKTYVVIGKVARVSGTGRLKLTVKVSRSLARRMRRQKRLTCLLRVTAIDGAHNATVATASVRLIKR